MNNQSLKQLNLLSWILIDNNGYGLQNEKFSTFEAVILYLSQLENSGHNQNFQYNHTINTISSNLFLEKINNLSFSEQEKFMYAYYVVSILREIGNTQKSLELMQSLSVFENFLDDKNLYIYYSALANSYKDFGNYVEANKYNNLLEKCLMNIKEDDYHIDHYLRLNMYYLERGEYEQALQYLEKAKKVKNIRYEYQIRIDAQFIQNYIYLGNTLEAWYLCNTTIKKLYNLPTYNEEAVLFAQCSHMSRGFFNLLQSEWYSRMAYTAKKLNKTNREFGSLVSKLALALTERQKGVEAIAYIHLAGQVLNITETNIEDKNILGDIAFIYYSVGDKKQAISFYKKSLELEIQTSTDDHTLLRGYAQLSAVSYNVDKKFSTECYNKSLEIAKYKQLTPYTRLQLGHLSVIELLKSNPDEMDEWYEFLRTDIQEVPKTLNFLYRLIHQLNDQLLANAPKGVHISNLSRNGTQIAAKGKLYELFCENGLLANIKKMGGLLNEIIEWVLQKSNAIGKRIIAEYFTNPLCLDDYKREKNLSSSVLALPQLEALMARVFYWEVQESKTQQLEQAMRNLENFYIKWRKEVTLEIPKESNNKNHTFTNITHKTTAIDLGITKDNYINNNLFNIIKTLYPDLSQRPILLDFLQFEKCAYWIYLDTKHTDLKQGIGKIKVEISKEQALILIKELEKLLVLQEENLGSFVDFQTAIYTILPKFFDILSPLANLFEPNRRVFLNLSSMWSNIPLENIPFDSQENSLMDLYKVSRRNPRKDSWLHQQVRELYPVRENNFAWIGGYDNKDLTFVNPSLDTIASYWNVKAEKEATFQIIEKQLEHKKVIHLECHGGNFGSAEAEKNMFSFLLLADGELLQQEIAALNLKSCELAFIAACHSAQGGMYGLAQVESIGSAFIAAGCHSVVAATSKVNDEFTAQLTNDFYLHLFKGVDLPTVLRAIIGKDAKKYKNIVISPFVLFGNDLPLKINYSI